MEKTKIYFASDFHLGSPNLKDSKEREERIIRWLDFVSKDAKAIYLLGDLFDFWHEYKTVIPKGFIRFQGKLAQLVDQGVEVIFFTGNHDLWMYGYFEKELGISVYHSPQAKIFNNKTFLIGHGDGLGPDNTSYKYLKNIFRNSFFQWVFRWLHPDIGMWIANKWSKSSRKSHKDAEQFHGEENEYLIVYCKEILKKQHFDYFIFGHRHLPIDFKFDDKNSRYINLGEWFSQNHYAVFDGNELQLLEFKG